MLYCGFAWKYSEEDIKNSSKWTHGVKIGTIVSSSVDTEQKRERTRNRTRTYTIYKPNIVYKYKVDGKEYINNTIGQTMDSHKNYNIPNNYKNKYPVNKTVDVIYNKKNPNISYLEYGHKRSMFMCLSGSSCCYILGFFTLIYGIFFVKKKDLFTYKEKIDL
jgi:hypothetical protein